MSAPPEKGGPTGESGAKALEKLPNHCSETPGEQLVFEFWKQMGGARK